MARKVHDTLIAHAAELIRTGANLKDAAAAIGCNPDELSKKLRTIVGLTIDKRRDWNALGDEIVSLYKSGMGTTAIAAHLGAPRHAASNVRDVLTRRGIMRDRSEANVRRFANAAIEQKRTITAKARTKRRRNLVATAESLKASHSIGFGEDDVVAALAAARVPFRRQLIVDDNYLVDVAIGNVAMEVTAFSTAATLHAGNSARFKKLFECGFTVMFVVVNHLPTIAAHANDIVAAVKLAQANQATRGEYWVVKCTLEQIGPDTDVDHWSVERRTPKHNWTRF
jgi:hypothetical protein